MNCQRTKSFPSIITLILLTAAAVAMPARAELIGFYPFDPQATPTTDASGKGNDLASTGNDPAYEADGGLSGGAYRYDGAQHLVSPININPDVLPNLTMGAWVRPTSLVPDLRKVIGQDDGGWDRVIGLDNRSGPFRYTGFTGFGPGPEELPAPTSTEQWAFIAAAYDEFGLLMTIYVDTDANTVGDDLFSIDVNDTFFLGGVETTAIGNIRADQLVEGWVGYIDNAFFFDETLTLSQLADMRNRGTPDLTVEVDPNFSAVSVPDLTALPGDVATHDIAIPIRNDGASKALHISSVTLAGADTNLYHLGTFPNQLTPSQTGTINVTLDSQAQVGTFQAHLVILTDDSVQPRTTLDLAATIMPTDATDPMLQIVTADPVVGQRPGGASPVTVDLKNSGAAQTLTIVSTTVTGPDASHYTIDSAPQTLAPGAAGSIKLTFNSQGEERSFAAQLEIISTDATGRLRTVDLTATVLPTQIRPSLVGFYPFDDAANPTKDESGNGHDLMNPTNEVATLPAYDPAGGYEGGGYSFDGTQLWVVPIDINASAIPELTMGAWVRPDSLEPDPLRKVMGHDDGAWDRTIGLDNRGGDFRYATFTGVNAVGPLVGLPAPENTEDWTFIAAVFNQTQNRVIAYIDLDASTTDDALVTASAEDSPFGTGFPNAAIGDLRPDGPSEPWLGSIDNAFFYNAALTAEQVTQIRNGGKAFILSGGAPEGPRITAVTANASAVSLTWTSLPAVQYRVDYTGILPGAWTQIATQASGGTSTTYQDTDAARRAKSTGFYRVAALP